MRKSKIINISKLTVITYFMGTVMIICAIFNVYMSYRYVSNLVKGGLEIKKQILDIINYYLSGVTPYLFYSTCLIALGYILNNSVDVVNKERINKVEESFNNKLIEEELDIYLEELGKN
ncbi:hypothetical protein [Clostridium rectalis]|uniref:hypothetical protein n=1 Tax=Clostridium rectalis TaxID=2040295 RepID=UPI000F62C675|nr:hypothetical protein [Clostridium rectalis]